MIGNQLASWLASAVLVLLFASGPVASSFLPTGFAYWFFQSALVAKNWLYIDGGEIWANWGHPGANASVQWNEQTFAIDLSKSWTTDSVVAVQRNKTTAPISKRPDLWYDSKKDIVRSVAGWEYNKNGAASYIGSPQEWEFQPKSDGSASWSPHIGDSGGPAANLQTVAGQYVTTEDSHFIYGGYYRTPGGSDEALSQMFISNFTSGKYENMTLPTTLNTRLTDGEGQYVPVFGTKGVILYFGGQISADSTRDHLTPAPLDVITVYDIGSKRLYQQAATNAPASRMNFCSASAGSTGNNGTYEIFIFGGRYSNFDRGARDNEVLQKVYILTLPSFTWIEAPNKAEYWRTTHTCTRVNNRQMISIGGLPGDTQGSISKTEIDALPNGLALFDMTTLEWTTKYDPDVAAYKPADIVTASYKTTGTYPLWSDPDLEKIFVRTDAPQDTSGTSTGTPTGTDSSGDSTSTNTDQEAPKKKAPIGAIAGGVVGGVAVIAIIAGILFWRRIQQKKGLSKKYKSVPHGTSEMWTMGNIPEAGGKAVQPVKSEMWTMGNIPETAGNPIHELPADKARRITEIGPGK
ncbi:hypothetical protein V494_06561 [Pseudogymnoascus sp. VKM F-4513 (FW-928)]|nr:hypothetical protein V494_06561 [Pseudogymnoascus sp. VKM F-4513 (FW-928)]